MKKNITVIFSYCQIEYFISKKKLALYRYNEISKSLDFYKKGIYHRACNEGPQCRNRTIIAYRENDKFNNLYGYAWINKEYNTKRYFINNKEYNKNEFSNYIFIYNNLEYERIY